MFLQTEPVEIVGRGLYDENDPKFGEFVRVQAPGDDSTRRYTLGREVNGDVKVGEWCRLTLESFMRATSRRDTDRVFFTEKWRVVACEAAQPVQAAA